MPFGLERVSVTAQVEALMPSQPSLELIALLAALVGDALVLLFVDDPWTRLLLGLLLLAVVVWSSARIGVLDIITRSPVEPARRLYQRRRRRAATRT